MIHRINIFLLSLLVALAPNFIFLQAANATTVAGEGWSVTKRLVQGATTFYDGAKNVVLNGKNYVATGTAAITPTASQVSKMIVRTGAVLAVDLAIKALIGAVDYTMDPANNRVIYRVPPDPNSPNLQYAWHWTNIGYYSTPTEAAVAYMAYHNSTASSSKQAASYQIKDTISDKSKTVNLFDSSGALVGLATIQWLLNPNYDPKAPPQENEEKYLPYDAVASQIMSDAVADKAEGKAYVSSVADTALEDEERQIVPANDMVQQLNSSQAIPTSNTATGSATPTTGTGTGTGDPTTQPGPTDITLNFPVFCNWAPTVCQAAQVAINFPGTVANYWKELKDWMNDSASDTSETKPEIKELELNFDDGSRINFDQTCPQPQPIQVTFMGVTQDASFSFEPLCNFMIMIRPFVIGSAYLIGAYIVMGLSRGNSE
ncbi:virulence factor TspB C-terminal domain-related protein [Acinetobacter baumannii]|nr:virulence factor TspB C-terminal domain-related protein [Acinetobacter baumannii]